MTKAEQITGFLIWAGTLVLTLAAGQIGLPLLKRLNVGQTVRDDGPPTHLKKSGTPTFGGIFFLLPLLILAVFSFLCPWLPAHAGVLILLALAFGLIGFVDDFIKVRISPKGLSVKQKTVWMLLASAAFSIYYVYGTEPAVFFWPLSGGVWEISGWVRLPYALFIVLVLYFTANSVNLTDGVDALAGCVTAISTLALAAAGLIILPDLVMIKAAGFVALALNAACLGFLPFNRHPARVFMGDTGSQALGAAFSGAAIMLGVPWLIIFVGIIYLIESFSVIIQVIYFKSTGGKRIFRMSPIHHHFELSGWSERKIVVVFSLITLAGSILGLAIL